MKSFQDLESLIAALDGDDVERQVEAVQQAARVLQQVAEAAARALERGPVKFIVAENLVGLGSFVVKPLESLLEKSTEEEVRILASLVLLELGSSAGVNILRQAVSENDEYAGLAANRLLQANIGEVKETVIERLQAIDPSRTDLVVSLLMSLKNESVNLPLELRRRLSAPDIPWQVRTLVEEMHRQ